MKIHFSQFFDERVYIKRALFNEKIIGPKGLLSRMELVLGISERSEDSIQRRNDFLLALQNYNVDHPDVFYGGSFQKDRMGVTRELMTYFEELTMAGVFESSKELPNRINVILDVANLAQCRSEGLRWKRVLELLETDAYQLPEILVYDNQYHLHPMFHRLFDFMKVTFVVPKEQTGSKNDLSKLKRLLAGKNVPEKLDGDGTLKVWQFDQPSDTMRYLNSHLSDSNAVLINQSYSSLDQEWAGIGGYHTGTSLSEHHSLTTQLFKLVSALFTDPLDLDIILAYLQVPIHPIPSGLRFELMKIISQKGGLAGELWNETILNFDYRDQKQKNRAILFTKFIPNDGSVGVEGIVNIYNNLGNWAGARSQVSERRVERIQLQHLRRICAGLTQLLEGMLIENLEVDMLNDLISEQYEPVQHEATQLQKNAPFTISDPGCLFDGVENLYWFDFYENAPVARKYQWLTYQEEALLKQLGYQLWSADSQLEALQYAQFRAISNVESMIVFCVCKGKEEHPLLTLIKSNWKDNFNRILETPKHEVQGTPCEPKIIQSNLSMIEGVSAIKKIGLRDRESYSSIDTLIQYPFDWLFSYGLELWPAQGFASSDSFTVAGNVAHLYFDEIFKEADKELLQARKIHESSFESRLNALLQNFGLVLLQKKNRAILNEYRKRLKKNIEGLLDFLESNQLHLVESEWAVEGDLKLKSNPVQKFAGFIDLLAKDNVGNGVIIDVKWARKTSKYEKKVAEGKDVQMGIYGALLKNSENHSFKHIHSVYGILSENKFISRDDFVGISKVENGGINLDVIWNNVRNSIQYRLDQFHQGEIEVAEGVNVVDGEVELSYVTDTADHNLIPLEIKGKVKAENYYSSYHVFKGKVS